jgi:hypothetical protein
MPPPSEAPTIPTQGPLPTAKVRFLLAKSLSSLPVSGLTNVFARSLESIGHVLESNCSLNRHRVCSSIDCYAIKTFGQNLESVLNVRVKFARETVPGTSEKEIGIRFCCAADLSTVNTFVHIAHGI